MIGEKRPAGKKSLILFSNNIHPGAIILMHDGGDWDANRTNTIGALRQIIPTLQQQGFEFVTVPQLLNIPYKNKNVSGGYLQIRDSHIIFMERNKIISPDHLSNKFQNKNKKYKRTGGMAMEQNSLTYFEKLEKLYVLTETQTRCYKIN
ncbi:hypothetical protein KHA80_21955 [Anaerobacillus sp. HL2]|nr:hypothetical protein KHA80_21955 [Anaerobacillus sp. HL2]